MNNMIENHVYIAIHNFSDNRVNSFIYTDFSIISIRLATQGISKYHL